MNGVAVDFDVALKNADVVEIVTRETSGVELLGGAGEASASAVANLVAKSKIALQRQFLGIARTRSARAKIKKFLADAGASISEDEDDDAVVAIADLDVMSSRTSTSSTSRKPPRSFASLRRISRARRRALARRWDARRERTPSPPSGSGATIRTDYSGDFRRHLRDRRVFHHGLRRRVPRDGEFVMTYTFAMDSSGVLAAAAERGGEDRRRRQKPRDARCRVRRRLAALFRELRRNPSVLEAKLFCKTGTRESPF